MDFHWHFIEISTGFPMDFHWYLNWYFIEIATGLRIDFHWSYIEMSIELNWIFY